MRIFNFIFTAQNMIRNPEFIEEGEFIIFQWTVLDECLSLDISYVVELFQNMYLEIVETTETNATFPKLAAPNTEVIAKVTVILEDYDAYEGPFNYTTGEYKNKLFVLKIVIIKQYKDNQINNSFYFKKYLLYFLFLFQLKNTD